MTPDVFLDVALDWLFSLGILAVILLVILRVIVWGVRSTLADMTREFSSERDEDDA